jgi:SSS family transporter
MLLLFVFIFLMFNLIIGVFAVKYVKTAQDFMLAGKRLPLHLATFTVFATWFGSETLLGASATFSEGGFISVIEDPFGGMLCLLLVGALFAKKLYQMNHLTLGDLFREKFGPGAELISSICMIISFFSWIAAQMVALGIAISLITGMDTVPATMISSLIVIIYTFIGGMWSVTITDFVQTTFIIVGLLVVAWVVFPKAGGFFHILESQPAGFFRIIPEKGTSTLVWLEYIAAWMTLGLGSIPSQDIYQRVMSSKTSNIARNSSLIAGLMYITIGMIPLFLALAAKAILKEQPEDSQMLLPQLVIQHTSLTVQALFFGALIAAVMSTASGATVAPASVISENLIKPRMKRPLSDKEFLWVNRMAVLGVSAISLVMALGRNNIYELVGEASAIGLVSLFIPMVMGLYTPWHGQWAGVLSMIAGILVWSWTYFILKTEVPAIYYGLAGSVLGYLLGMICQPIMRKFRLINQ